MALYTKLQFAEKCKIGKKGTAYIATYIKRGKIIPSGDYIDDTIPENAEFLRKQIEKNQSKKEAVVFEKHAANIPKVEQANKTLPEVPNIEEPEYVEGNGYAIDKKIKVQQLAKLKVDTRLQELKEQKLRGEVVPRDQIEDLIARFSKSIITESDNMLDNLLTRMTAKYKISNTDQSTERGNIKEGINHMIKMAIEETLNTLEDIVDAHAESRQRGERK